MKIQKKKPSVLLILKNSLLLKTEKSTGNERTEINLSTCLAGAGQNSLKKLFKYEVLSSYSFFFPKFE